MRAINTIVTIRDIKLPTAKLEGQNGQNFISDLIGQTRGLLGQIQTF